MKEKEHAIDPHTKPHATMPVFFFWLVMPYRFVDKYAHFGQPLFIYLNVHMLSLTRKPSLTS